MDKELLYDAIRVNASKLMDARQVAKRLRDLLPARLNKLQKSYRQSNPSAVSLRYALISNEYKDYLEELVQVNAEALHCKVQYETHMMLLHARQSLNRLRRS